MDAVIDRPVVAAPQEPIRIPMTSVLLAALAVLATELVVGVLLRVDLHPLALAMCVSTAVLFGLVFSLGAITIAGFATGVAAAGVAVLEPGHLPTVLAALALLALACGVAPGWARVEAWQAVRSAPTVDTGRTAAGSGLPSWLRVRWRTDRVVAAFLVLAFPPLFVTGAIAFIAWTATR